MSSDDPMGQIIVRPEFLLRPQRGTHWPLMAMHDPYERAQGFVEIDVRSSRVPGSLDPAPRRQFGQLGHYRELTDQVTGRNFWFDVWTREDIELQRVLQFEVCWGRGEVLLSLC